MTAIKQTTPIQTSEKPQPAPTGATQIAAAFARHGVTITFGQSIPTAFHLASPCFGIDQKVYRTENAGGAMADGYARISNKVGVVTAQNGPAATLLVAPLAEALKVSVPLLALVQEVTRDTTDKNAFQELDHLKLFEGVTKWVRRIDVVSRIDDYVDMAFTIATTGRPGPVVLLVPADLLTEAVSPSNKRQAKLGHFPLDRTSPDREQIKIAAQLLANAKAPLVIAGGGVHLSQATAALADLQERCHLPVATTVMGKGSVDENHPLSLGIVGYFMGEGARTEHLHDMVRRADVILLIGNRTNQNGTNSWRLLPSTATYIHLDIDGAEIGRNYESVRLVGDAKLGIEALTQALVTLDLSRRLQARASFEQEIAGALNKYSQYAETFRASDNSPIRPERVMADIDRVMTRDTIVVADASYSSIWITNCLTAVGSGTRFITPRGLAGLGWGLPLAIGAKVAAPNQPVICVTGDGGFAHCWAELETAVRLKLSIPIIVLNNQILGFQKDSEDVLFGAHSLACDLGPVDHAAIAVACGGQGVRVEEPRYLKSAIEDALRHAGPTVIDVITDPEARPPLTFYRGRFPAA